MRSSALKSRRSRVVAPLAITMTSVALIAAGCGGSEKEAVPGADAASVANYIPSSAVVYAEMSTDFEGEQWQQIDKLAKTFPAYPELRKELDDSMAKDGVDFDRDIKPVLGKRAAIGVVEIPQATSTTQMVITAPTGTGTTPNIDAIGNAADKGKFVAAIELQPGKEADAEKLIAKDATVSQVGSLKVYSNTKDKSVATVVPGAILVGSGPEQLQAAIDAKKNGGGATLAGSSRYTEAIGKLPQQTFAQGYVDLGKMIQMQAASNPALQSQAKMLDMYKDMRMATSAAAEAEGARVKGVTIGGPEGPADTSFSPTLNARVPANALAYFGFKNLQAQVGQSLKQYAASGANPQVMDQANMAAGQMQSMLGITLDDLKALSKNEHALVVVPGVPYPQVALALQVDDGARATKTLDSLRTASPGLLQQANLPNPSAQWAQVPLEGGVTGWDLPISPTGHVTYGVDGNLAMIGSSPTILKAVQRPTQPLAESDGYKKALAGMPDDVTSVVWINVGEAVRLGEAAGAFKNDPEAVANLRRIASISGWSTGGKEQTFEMFFRLNPA